jgi:hypothetical protein
MVVLRAGKHQLLAISLQFDGLSTSGALLASPSVQTIA